MRLLIGALLGLGLAIAILSVASARFGPSVDSMMTAQTFDGTAVNTQIALTFTDAMNTQSVQKSFRITPHVTGNFTWSGNTLLFSPEKNLAYGTAYSITVGANAADTSGKHLFRTYRRSFVTQQEHLVYLGTEGSTRNRLVLASTAGKREIAGPNDGSVADFSVSFDRSAIVFVRRGASNERPDELWLLSLADGSTQRILRRPDWNIGQPQLSPDGKSVAFLATNVRLCRQYYGCYRDTTSPIVELLDLRSRQVSPFHAASDTPITNFIAFSPAGQLAFTDLGSALTVASVNGQSVIHIPNRGNSLEFAGFDRQGAKAVFVGQTADSTGGDVLVYDSRHSDYTDISRHLYDASTPAFSSSGDRVGYAGYRSEVGIEPVYGVDVYSFKTRRTAHLTSEREWSDWAPRWSPDDRFVAFVRSRPQEAMYMGTGEVWVTRSNGIAAHPLGGIGTDIAWVL